MNCKRKGTARELKTKKLLEKQGYQCCKAGGSLGVWDIIAVGPGDVLLIQVKSNRNPGAKEMERMRAFPAPSLICKKLVYKWVDRKPLPFITYIQ